MPGEIVVTLQYSVPTDVVDVQTRVPPRATVTATDGFIQRDGREYRWDRQTATPTLTYRLSVNETLDFTGPIAGNGDYTFVDRGDWALMRVPATATGWSWTGGGTVGLSRETTTAGPGAVGDSMAYLGEHREVTRTANGQTFRLIIPARAELAESPTRILDSMAAASHTLQVGDRDETVFMIAAPTESTRWGVRGLQTGDSDVWVRDSERLDTADNTWLHEYVHTRQGYTASTDVRWFTEASATYYAALLTLQQDRIGFQAFRDRLALGTRTPDRSAVLADPTTWDTIAPYTKGALVAGELDRQTRQTTAQTQSLQDVLSRMNTQNAPVTGSEFREMVRQIGGDDTVTLTDRYTSTREIPSTWDQQTHEQVFGATPARIGYTLSDPENTASYRVSGPYRTEAAGMDRPIRLATGETLSFEVTASNTGGTAGEYDARVQVNGKQTDRQQGRLAPGATTTLTFSHTFATAGEYRVAVGGSHVAVSVRMPAQPTVTSITAQETTTTGPATYAVEIIATIQNDHTYPAAGNFTLYQNGKPLATQRVQLAPNEERTISYNATVEEAGEHIYRLGGQQATVTIAPAAPPTPDSETTSTESPGFGVGVTLLAIVSLIIVLVRKQ
ncbi:CARDB domain-containing protein [Halorubrum salinum]|uniref:CARDB domain-containing protein n=1 Tax=Halorubrum salinum TaxID=767517 RepID=UPI0021119B5B|nr:CARDB domain-containing protein [Halorubrum salinum]